MLKLQIVYLQTLTRYASGLKTLISCINNFKRLTHKSVQIVSLHMINKRKFTFISKKMFQIGAE